MKTIRLKIIVIPVAVLALLLIFAGALLAQGDGLEIFRHVSGDCGGTLSGGNVVLSGTLGQTAVGSASGGKIYLTGGFWYPDTGPAPVPQGVGGEVQPVEKNWLLASCLASGLLLLLAVFLGIRASRRLRRNP